MLVSAEEWVIKYKDVRRLNACVAKQGTFGNPLHSSDGTLNTILHCHFLLKFF